MGSEGDLRNMGSIKRSPDISNKHEAMYAKISKSDLVEAYRDLYRIAEHDEFDDEHWMKDLQDRVALLKMWRKAWKEDSK